MSRKIVIEGPAVNRRQPLLPEENEKHRKRIGEVAGGAAAECTAVCCCCPCMLMNLLILTVFKVPKDLCKNAWRKKKRKRLMKQKKKDAELHKDESDGGESIEPYGGDETADDDGAKEDVDFDKEMWDRFYGAGFWRSPSQRQKDE